MNYIRPPARGRVSTGNTSRPALKSGGEAPVPRSEMGEALVSTHYVVGERRGRTRVRPHERAEVYILALIVQDGNLSMVFTFCMLHALPPDDR